MARARKSSKMNYNPKPATCKRCGSKLVTWNQGQTGKWYLTEIFRDLDGASYSKHTDFHSNFCGIPESHDYEQAARTGSEVREQDEHKRDMEESRRKDEQTNMDHFLALLDLDEEGKLAKLAQLQAEEENFKRNPPTMDYMTEFEREVRAAKFRRAEIGFLLASLSND